MLLAENLGAEAVIVGTITRYDPYPPPQMGMALQLYVRQDGSAQNEARHVDPGEIARIGKPTKISSIVPISPQSMLVKILDAGQSDVVKRIKKYANSRQTDKTPYKWKKFIAGRNFLRFVCHEMIGQLLTVEHLRIRKKG